MPDTIQSLGTQTRNLEKLTINNEGADQPVAHRPLFSSRVQKARFSYDIDHTYFNYSQQTICEPI